ncbi:MAG: FtsW/RodA/SpoVE family cell cycle protein [Alphaproteobacteria bacterium]|nr:FtsW/RodA/SpoVE family cell cycle protein [Alphaproteobacteria bacterium]
MISINKYILLLKQYAVVPSAIVGLIYNFLKEYFDGVLFLSAVTLFLFGFITNSTLFFTDSSTLVIKHGVFFFVFLLTIMLGRVFPHNIFRQSNLVSPLAYTLACVALVSLLFFATPLNGARGWFVLGPIAIQPIDMVALTLIFVLARYFMLRHVYIKRIQVLIPPLCMSLFLVLLVLLQPDLGGAVVLLGIAIIVIIYSGVSLKHFFSLVSIGIVTAVILWHTGLPAYQKERLVAFLDPYTYIDSTGYNTYQSLIAIGSGGLFGKGIGEGDQSKLGFLPFHESDFIFASFSEEWGFIGVLLCLSLFFIFLLRLGIIVYKSSNTYDALILIGIWAYFFMHIFIHIGVNIGWLPVTGITLPFMSYGGSHIVVEGIAIGIATRIAKSERLI